MLRRNTDQMEDGSGAIVRLHPYKARRSRATNRKMKEIDDSAAA